MEAEKNGSRREPPLNVRRRGIRRCTNYTGSRSQLIEAGVITETTILPGDPGSPRKSYTNYGESHPQRLVYAWPRPGGRYTVMVCYSHEECAKLDAEDLRREREIERKEAERKHQRSLEDWPTSHEGFRKYVDLATDWAESGFRVVLRKDFSAGYCFDADTRERVELLLQQIRGALVEGRTEFDPDFRAEKIQESLALVSQKDHGFRSFLDRLGGDAS